MRRVTILILAIALFGAGCSAEEAATTTTVAATAPTSMPATTTTDVVTTAADTPATSTTSAASTTATPATAVEEPARLLLAGLEPIEQTGPTSGEGLHPELSWEPLESVGHYVLYLYTPEGDVYWSWQGTDTSVPVGGRPQLPDTAEGPAVTEGMSWAVVAYNADQIPIGSSELAPIGP